MGIDSCGETQLKWCHCWCVWAVLNHIPMYIMWSRRLWDRVSQFPDCMLARFTILPVLSWLTRYTHAHGVPHAEQKLCVDEIDGFEPM